MSQLQVVVDGQFGSCGKGAVTAALLKRHRVEYQPTAPVLSIRVAGPNAGHTVIGEYGIDTSPSRVAPHLCERGTNGTREYAWRLRHTPVAAVADPHAVLALAAGSELDLDVLLDEVDWLDQAGYGVRDRLMVDEQATVISADDQFAETTRIGTGTTGKGIGAARARRLMRDRTACLATNEKARARLDEAGIRVVTSDEGGVAQIAAGILRQSGTLVQVEGTQGYGLGLRSGFYPYTTSSDCRAIDFLAMAGISPWLGGSAGGGVLSPQLSIWVALRPYPIRIAGNSGPLKGETTWEDLGLPEEITTVTRKTRRVGEWDRALARRAIQANGGPGGAVRVALTMFDQVRPEAAGLVGDRATLHDSGAAATVGWYEREIGQSISYLGTGPDTGIWL